MTALSAICIRQADADFLCAYAYLRYVTVLINVILIQPTRINHISLILFIFFLLQMAVHNNFYCIYVLLYLNIVYIFILFYFLQCIYLLYIVFIFVYIIIDMYIFIVYIYICFKYCVCVCVCV